MSRLTIDGVVSGLGTAVVIVLLDVALFGGITISRIPALGAQPAIAVRVLIALYDGIFEELVFRVMIVTAVASVVFAITRRRTPASVAFARIVGIVSAAALAGLYHVGDPSHFARVMTVNGIAGLVYGYLYWWRGLESAMIAHTVVSASLYIGVPLLGHLLGA